MSGILIKIILTVAEAAFCIVLVYGGWLSVKHAKRLAEEDATKFNEKYDNKQASDKDIISDK